MSENEERATERYRVLREVTNPRELHKELADTQKLPAGYKWKPMLIDDGDDVGDVIAERVDEILDQAIEYQWELHDADELTED